MQITTLANIKGGSGKSTTALNLAITGHYLGHRTAAIDIDKQASLAKLGERRREAGRSEPMIVQAKHDDFDLVDLVESARAIGIEHLFIDTSGHLEQRERLEIACRPADLILMPLKPMGPDFEALPETLEWVARLGLLERLQPLIVDAPPKYGFGENKMVRLAHQELDAFGLEALPIIIRRGQPIIDGYVLAKGGIEVDPRHKACALFVHLYRDITRALAPVVMAAAS